MSNIPDNYVDATIFVQVAPVWHPWKKDTLDGAKLARATMQKPQVPVPGTVMTKLTIRLPRAAFYPLRPEAVIVVPEDMTTITPIEVKAEDANADQ